MTSCRLSRSRRGAVLVAALVCLLIVMTMLGGMLLAAVRSTRQLQRERDLRQCELLLDAGLDRAAQRLATDATYRGEIWSLTFDAITGSGEGQVTIEVASASDATSQQINVVAEYPLGGETSIQRSRSILVPPKTIQPTE